MQVASFCSFFLYIELDPISRAEVISWSRPTKRDESQRHRTSFRSRHLIARELDCGIPLVEKCDHGSGDNPATS